MCTLWFLKIPASLTILNRVYNWIKYKSLPPSINFKNRLFIERENKHRRVVFNLGLTFRNSKWSDYRRPNLNQTFISNFKLLIRNSALIVMFIILLSICWYSFTPFNNVNFRFLNLWIFSDTTFYTKLMVLSAWAASGQLFLEVFFKKFYTPQSTNYLRPVTKTTNSKLSDKAVFYHWLISGTNRNFTKTLESLYNVDTGRLNPSLTSFYQTVFKLATMLNSKVTNLPNLQMDTFSVPGVIKASYLAVHLTTNLRSCGSQERRRVSAWAFTTKLNWTLPHDTSAITSGVLRSAPSGLFNIPMTNFTNFLALTNKFPEMVNLEESLSLQLRFIKESRWLYKYNLLHRKFLLSSHTSTLTKRLLGSGFYGESFFAANKNSSSINPQLQSPSLLANLYQHTYGDFTQPTQVSLTKLLGTKTPLQLNFANSLSFYESSYFWFVKRFYFYNTLPASARVSQLETTSQSKLVAQVPSWFNYTITNHLWVLNSFSQNLNALGGSIQNLKQREVDTFTPNRASPRALEYNRAQLNLFNFDFTDLALKLLTSQTSTPSTSLYYYSPVNAKGAPVQSVAKLVGLK